MLPPVPFLEPGSGALPVWRVYFLSAFRHRHALVTLLRKTLQPRVACDRIASVPQRHPPSSPSRKKRVALSVFHNILSRETSVANTFSLFLSVGKTPTPGHYPTTDTYTT